MNSVAVEGGREGALKERIRGKDERWRGSERKEGEKERRVEEGNKEKIKQGRRKRREKERQSDLL